MSNAVLEPTTEIVPRRQTLPDLPTALPARVTAAALCVAVAVIHIKDQGGFPGNKQPTYVGIAYYLLELGAIAAAVLLLGRASRKGWFLSLGVALGPLIGYALSRGPGLPLYSDDRGNWMETIGIISILLEGVLLLLCLGAAWRQERVAAEPI